MDIGNTVRKYRKMRGMTQEELAEGLAVTPQAVSRWENGLSYPDIAMIPEIVKLLRVSADELLGTGGYGDGIGPEILNQDQADSVFEEFEKFEKPDGAAKSVLVIDDAEFMRDTVSDILGSKGHRVWQAESGEAGLEALKRSERPGGVKFDLCLLDIRMPGRDGLEILEQIGRLYPSVKVVMLSAAGTRENVELSRDLGASAFVVKPFQPARLLEKI